MNKPTARSDLASAVLDIPEYVGAAGCENRGDLESLPWRLQAPKPALGEEQSAPTVPRPGAVPTVPFAPHEPIARARPSTLLAFDFGTRRVGVASGNTVTRSATPLLTLALEGKARFAAIGELIGSWRPDALVVGVPRHPDGVAHENTRLAQRFARQLQGRYRLPVHEVDERYSTVAAEAEAGPGGCGKAGVDAAAAAILLEQFLRRDGTA